jgi:hypothetical protein
VEGCVCCKTHSQPRTDPGINLCPELLKAQEILSAARSPMLAAFDISNLKELRAKNCPVLETVWFGAGLAVQRTGRY